MASAYVPGPCPIFVKFVEITTPFFLGISERGVNININPEYSPYVVDAAGSVQADLSYQGQSATVSGNLTRWSESVYQAVSRYVNRAGAVVGTTVPASTAGRGTDFPGDVGTLMAAENQALMLFVVFPYANKVAYGTGLGIDAQPRGYRFVKAILDQDSLPDRGARPASLNLVWRCVRELEVVVGGNAGLGNYRWKLYDHDMDTFPVRFADWT